jgi:hypothetical protein
MVQYLVDNYSGDPCMADVAIEMESMHRQGVQVTPAIIDYLFRTESMNRIRAWRERHDEAKQVRASKADEGFVYFIRNGDRIKIGYSVDPGSRALSLSLREANVMAVIGGTRKLERALHKRFSHLRVGDTEWFHESPDLLAYVDEYGERFTKHHRSRRKRQVGQSSSHEGYVRLAKAMGVLPLD